MTDEIDNAPELVSFLIGGLKKPRHTQVVLPGPVDDAVLLVRYEGTTALLQYAGLSAKCQSCACREPARFPVGQKQPDGSFEQVPGAHPVPPIGWQEGTQTQPMLCPRCLAEVPTP